VASRDPAALSPGSIVFCYGTLLFPEVMQLAAGVALAGRPALADGWARYRVRGEVFPALIAQAGARTGGAVFAGVDADALARLDAFEGSLYVRRTLEVVREDGVILGAEAWVLAPGREAELTREAWDAEAFASRDLRDYLARIRASGTPYAGDRGRGRTRCGRRVDP
jgi:gamma-glutamylcyclotransferase (GGCT)/AIG2-like uncharacterized protein YtfP